MLSAHILKSLNSVSQICLIRSFSALFTFRLIWLCAMFNHASTCFGFAIFRLHQLTIIIYVFIARLSIPNASFAAIIFRFILSADGTAFPSPGGGGRGEGALAS